MSELPSQALEGAAPDPPDPLLGRLLAGKYKLETKLGEGGMGAVYRARQVALEKTIAVKVMHAQLASDPMFAERFHREAKAASRLDHPNSINIIDFGGEPDGLLYIAMEFLDGRDLLHIVEEEAPLPVARIVDVLAQALSALAVAHDMGIIHRDLKPENIMVLRRKGEDERVHDVVKVCDFGIAKVADSAETEDTVPADGAAKKKSSKLTTAGLVIGTPEYMSPEQGRGEALDARCDLYSMGVILYLLLSGKTPFDAPTPLGIVLKHQSEQPLPPSVVRPLSDLRLEKVCLKAMSKKPSDRYATAREMRAALRAVVDGPMTEVIVPPTRIASAHEAGAKTELLVAQGTEVVAEGPAANGVPAEAAPLATFTGGGAEVARATTGATGALTAPAPTARPKSRTVLLVGGGFLAIALVGGGAMYGWTLRNEEADAPVAKSVKPREAPSSNVQPPAPSPQAPAPAPAPSSSAASHDALKAVVTSPTAIKQKTSPLGSPVESHRLGEAVSVVPPAPSAPAEPPPAPPAPAPEPPHAQQPLPVVPPPPPFNPSAARVTAAQASILGGGTNGNVINGLVRGSLGAMSDCYRASATPSSFEGSSNLHIGSDDEGHIIEARLDGPLPSQVKSCVAQTIVGKSVSADTGALSANVVLSFKLR